MQKSKIGVAVICSLRPLQPVTSRISWRSIWNLVFTTCWKFDFQFGICFFFKNCWKFDFDFQFGIWFYNLMKIWFWFSIRNLVLQLVENLIFIFNSESVYLQLFENLILSLILNLFFTTCWKFDLNFQFRICLWWGVRSDVQLSCTETRLQKCSQSGKNGSKHPILAISMAYNVISCKKIERNA